MKSATTMDNDHGDTTGAAKLPSVAAPAGSIKARTRAALVLETAGAVATIGSVIAVVEICRELLTASRSADRLWSLVFTAIVAVTTGLAAQTAGRALSQGAAVHSREFLRSAVAARLRGGSAARSTHAAWRAQGATLGSDIVSAGLMVGRAGSELASAVEAFVLWIVYLFWVDWRMALVTLTPILIGFGVFGVITTRFYRELSDDYQASIGPIDAVRPEIALDARINRAGSRARTASVTRTSARRLSEAIDGFSEFFKARFATLLGGRAIAEIAFSPLVVLLFVLCGGVPMVRAGWLAPADLVPFLVVGAGLAAPLLAITYFLEEVAEGKRALTRLTAFAAGDPSRTAPDDQSASSGDGTALELPDRGVLTVIDTAPGGADRLIDQITTIVPPERLAAVLAEPAVVLGPIGEYICADRATSQPGDAERAARIAGVHDTILRLPRGYGSVVGAEVSLSYPEVQRLALSRAIAGARGVVLLDERAFPGDTEVLRAAVSDLGERATVAVVSSHPPAVTGGHVVVMEAGQVVESGTPEQLLRAGGRYAAMSARPIFERSGRDTPRPVAPQETTP